MDRIRPLMKWGGSRCLVLKRWPWHPFCSLTHSWLERLIRVDGHLLLSLMLHSKDFLRLVRPEKQSQGQETQPVNLEGRRWRWQMNVDPFLCGQPVLANKKASHPFQLLHVLEERATLTSSQHHWGTALL